MSNAARYLFLPLAALAMLALFCQLIHQKYGLRYQISPSMPKGWYEIHYMPQPIQRHSLIVFKAPEPYEDFLLSHHLIPDNGELLKEVIAVPGDTACIKHHQLWVNSKAIAKQNPDIINDKTIPKENFCGTLSSEEYLVLGPFHPRSYDSRYFGPIPKANIIAIATKL